MDNRRKRLALIIILGLTVVTVSISMWGLLRGLSTLEILLFTAEADLSSFLSLLEPFKISLIAVAVFIVAVAYYQLNVGALPVPVWLRFRRPAELVRRLAFIGILLLVNTLLRNLVLGEHAERSLGLGLLVVLMAVILLVSLYAGPQRSARR